MMNSSTFARSAATARFPYASLSAYSRFARLPIGRLDVAFFLRGPMDELPPSTALRFSREAPRVGLTGICEIELAEGGVVSETVEYDLNLASNLLRSASLRDGAGFVGDAACQYRPAQVSRPSHRGLQPSFDVECRAKSICTSRVCGFGVSYSPPQTSHAVLWETNFTFNRYHSLFSSFKNDFH
jgi:hypothetical protein